MVLSYKAAVVGPTATVKDALKAIESSGLQIALVVDEDERLLGTVTDGDVRRGILNGVNFDSGVRDIMNRTPKIAQLGSPDSAIRAIMTSHRIHQIPLIGPDGRLAGVRLIDDLMEVPAQIDTPVILMAGGLGTRLRPLTETLPKPMIPVGGRPILENIISNFAAQGFHRFHISVNYLADLVRDHFGDGSAFGVNIQYLMEQERKGTAGALSLIDERPDQPVIVMNGDLLTTVNFRRMLDFHNENALVATMGVREYKIHVPYGVVDTDGHRITGLREKPIHTSLVNAGIYVLSPEAMAAIPSDRQYDMPDLFVDLQGAGHEIGAFPLHEYWMDIGRLEDLERARIEFPEAFP